MFYAIVSWILIPRRPIQLTPTRLRGPPTPLLEKERHSGPPALIPQIPRPPAIHMPGADPTLPSHDHPVKPIAANHLIHERAQVDRPDERLTTQKPHCCRYRQQVPNPVVDRLILHRSPDPYVTGEPVREQIGVPPDKSGRPGRTLGQDLIHVAINFQHHPEALTGEVLRDLMMEQVRHGIDEHPARIPPRPGHSQPLGPHPNRERIATILLRYHNRRRAR